MSEMQDHELDAWLGDTEVTATQREAIQRAADAIDARWPHPDLEDTRRDALNAAAEVILGDTTDATVAADYAAARAAERTAQARLTGAIIAGDIAGSDVSEVAHAARLGVTRMTLRKALRRA